MMFEKLLSFRPFRRVGDKIVVTSYMGWRKIYTSNHQGAVVNLLPFPTVKKGETVFASGNPNGKYNYWHPTKFEPLFWPSNAVIRHISGEKNNPVYEKGVVEDWNGTDMRDDQVYSMFDCDSCPVFSHVTSIYVSENYPNKIHLFEPLTVEVVYKYFEIMRDSLLNIKWQR